MGSSALMTKRQLLKALSMNDGGGAEVTLQTTVASEIVPLIRQQAYLRQLAQKSGALINMTKPKIRIPKLVRAQGVYGVQPGRPAPEFKARMEGIDLVPEKLMAWLPIESEVFEDATIRDIESILREEMAREFAQGEEIAFLWGDRDTDHGDGDPRNLFNGLLKQAAAPAYQYDETLDSADGTGIVSNLVRAMRYLGIYGRNKKDITIFVGLFAEEALIRNAAFQRMSSYAFGQGAGIYTGEIGRIAGATVIATSFLDPLPGETTARAMVLNNTSFAIGDWQTFTVKVYNELLAQTDEVAIRARERVAFATRYPEAILTITGMPVNISNTNP